MNENFENREQKKEWVSQPIDRKVEAIGYEWLEEFAKERSEKEKIENLLKFLNYYLKSKNLLLSYETPMESFLEFLNVDQSFHPDRKKDLIDICRKYFAKESVNMTIGQFIFSLNIKLQEINNLINPDQYD